MPKDKLISVKDASSKTGIAEETIHKHITAGRLRGEKRNYFLWDEWFVSPKELEKLHSQDSKQSPSSKSSAKTAEAGKVSTATQSSTITRVKEHNKTSSGPPAHTDPSGIAQNDLAAQINEAFTPNTFAEAFGSASQASTESAESTEIALLESDAARAPGEGDNQQAWGEYRQRAKTVAEEFLAPLLARLEMQANLLREKDLLIAKQSAQLRLLPDFQRQAEESEQLVQAKEQEASALRQKLTWERKKSLIKISAWQMKHIKAEEQMKEAAGELRELAIAQEQKEHEVDYLHCQLTQLQAQLTDLQRPWWKKIFKSSEH